jgi:hypothetical protein
MSNGLCRTECSGQYCGIDDSTSALQGAALYDNTRFPVVYPSCEVAFMKSTFPPNSSQIIDLMIPPVNQLLQVGVSNEKK